MNDIYNRYRAWLLEHGETEEHVPYDAWLAGTFPGDAALRNQLVVAEVVGGNLTKEQASRSLARVGESADEDLAAGLTALARTRLSRIANTMEFVDRVENRLMQRINIEEASIDQLLAAGRLLRTSLKDDTTLVSDVLRARKEKPQEPSSFRLNFTQNVVNLGDQAAQMTLQSRDSRDRTRSVLDSMIRTVQKNGNSEPSAA
jgi:hypothetical protein